VPGLSLIFGNKRGVLVNLFYELIAILWQEEEEEEVGELGIPGRRRELWDLCKYLFCVNRRRFISSAGMVHRLVSSFLWTSLCSDLVQIWDDIESCSTEISDL